MILGGTSGRDKWKDAGTAALLAAGAWILLAVCFDFYYDLNDDTAMKDILSGTYTGTPDGHNIQMLYPLGLALALCYRLLPQLPWYGIFLCGCQFLALYLGLSCVISRMRGRREKTAAACLLTAAVLGLFLYEYVFVQYTVTAGLLVCAAVVRLFAGSAGEGRGLLRYQIGTAVVVALAFFLRTEMALLLSPFLALAAGFRIMDGGATEGMHESRGHRSSDRKYDISVIFRNRRHILQSFAVFFAAAALLAVPGLAADRMAYGSEEWKAFRQFFDDRTQVYDFYGLPDYAAHREFYESVGITEAEYTLLTNYNFDLDEKIDTRAMEQIADYAASHQETGAARRLYLSVYTYIYRFTHGQELAFDILALVSYFFLIRAALRKKSGRLFLELAALFTVRTGLWLFLLYRGRVPERITHPLYLAELVMLGLFFLREGTVLQWKKYEKWAILSLYVLLFLCVGVSGAEAARREYTERENRNVQWQDWKAYCRQHPEQFYYLDVYSTVAYSEKMFSDTSPAFRNFDLLGGWCVKSPLAAAKREAAGLAGSRRALTEGKALFAADPGTKTWDPEFMAAYYRETGTEILMQEADTCGRFTVYRILEQTDKE